MTKNQNHQDNKKKQSAAIGLGLVFGAAIGLLLDNLLIGIAIGLLLGVAYSSSGTYGNKKKIPKNSENSQEKK